MTQSQDVPVRVGLDVQLPEYASKDAAGADVRAYIAESLVIQPGKICIVPTGLFMEIPEGFEVQVRPRSGLAAKSGITVLNTPGTIDADYRGEIKVILINHSESDFIVEPGMRIAQVVLCPVIQARFIQKEELSETARGSGGFGHTGVK
jgi:dUTP pyrophosphatase